MKANEIQIGDWLHYEGHNAFPFKVKSIIKKKVGYCIDPNEHRMYYLRLSKCKPISITPEILEKNGWEKRPTGYVFYTDGKRYDNSLWYIFGSSTFVVNTAEFQIKFVHQLQHALRLCEIDKEIKL